MRAIAIIISAALLSAEPVMAASWLEQKLREVDQTICQNYQSIKCKKRQRKAAVTAPKPVSKPAAVDAAVATPRPEPQPPKAGSVVPRPRPKPVLATMMPEEEVAPEPKGTVIAKTPPPADASAEQPVVPVPPEKPVAEAKVDLTEAPLTIPPPRPRQKPKLSAKVAVIVPREDTAEKTQAAPPPSGSCLTQLAALGVSFTVVTKSVGKGACQVKDPVQLTAQKVGGNTVNFPDQPTLNCNFAVNFAKWMREKGAPIASASGNQVAKFYTGPGYQCRGRNGDGSAKISEHGYGNAIDIERVEMGNGQVITVGSGRQGPVPDMRKSACEYFTTVLGPGANAAHSNHLHFDLGRHGASGTYRICQ